MRKINLKAHLKIYWPATEAISYFEKLLNQSDKHVSALYHLGRAHMKNFDYEKAKIYFRIVMELDPENANASSMFDFLISA